MESGSMNMLMWNGCCDSDKKLQIILRISYEFKKTHGRRKLKVNGMNSKVKVLERKDYHVMDFGSPFRRRISNTLECIEASSSTR